MPLRILLIFFFLIIFFQKVFSQSSDVNRGCVPLTVNFTAPQGYTTFYWDFKDGASSVLQNPSNVFITPGVYNVEFRTSQNGSVIGTITITVYPKPLPTITTDSLPNKGCTPYRVNFSANANAPAGVTISKYEWTFGDGFAGNGITTSHTYTQAGYYPVGLELTSPTPSCNVTLLIDSFVFATGLTGNATVSPLVACTAPHTVNFTNNLTSNTNSVITYLWQFGDGSTSTAKTPPAKTYQDTGVYQLKLTATDANGCKWILDTVVRIKNFEADFNMKDTVCAHTRLELMGKTVTGATYLWNVNGADSVGGTNTQNTWVVYNTPGKYNIVFFTLVSGCFKSKTKQVVVINPTVNAVVKPDTVCSKSFSINVAIKDSFKVDSVLWYFTYKPSQVVSRIKAGNISSSIPFDTITWFANDTVCARIFTKYGCVIDTCFAFFYPTIAHVAPSETKGCAPLSIDFTNKTYSVYPLNYWVIEYGDGTKDSLAGNIQQIAHTYSLPGKYPVKIRVKNNKGCEDTSYITYIYVNKKPRPNFSISKTNVCPKESLTLTNLTPTSDSVQKWHYWADGQTVAHCYQDSNVTFSYRHQAGVQTIKLEVFSDECPADTSLPIFVNGPIAKFRYKQYCDSGYFKTVDFIDQSQIATRVTYHFGDGNFSTSRNPRHTYANEGIYTVTMVAYNDTNVCSPDTFSQKVIIAIPQVQFAMDTVICAAPLTYININPFNSLLGTGCGLNITWLLKPYEPYNQRSADTVYLFENLDSGYYHFGAIVETAIGCKDTAFINLRVNKIYTNIAISDNEICIPQRVEFKANVSSSVPLDTFWWNFGDGSSLVYGKDSVAHTYTANKDSFLVQFYALNNIGCYVFEERLILTNQIFASIGLSNTSICRGDTVAISTNPNADLKFLWDYGNGTTDTISSKKIVYDTTGVILISLTYTDRDNAACTKKAQAALFVNDAPKIGISSSVDSTLTFCFPLNIRLKYTDTNSTNVTDVVWTLNNQNKYFLDSVALTLSRGVNTLTLITTNNYGCKDSTSRFFNVIGPLGDFSIDTNNICVNEKIVFTIKDTNEVASFLWDFGDGITLGDTSPVAHIYTFVPNGGSTKAKLTVYGAGKTCPFSTDKTINLKDVFADFSSNGGDTAVCFGATYTLDNLSKNADAYYWDFGDGKNSTLEEPGTVAYSSPGTYTISLFIQNIQFGCKDTVSKVVIIYPIPESKAQGDTICYGDSAYVLALNPNDTVYYIWEPATILNPDTGKISAGKFSQSTKVVLNAVNQFGCNQIDSAMVVVILPSQDVIFDTIVPLGSTVVLPFEPMFGYSYYWQPDTGLNCYGCKNPIVKTVLEKKLFSVTYQDTILNCFDGESKYTIDIYPETFIKVPNTFSPNGDGKNDKIFAEGWGVKELLFFRIYNRWSELVFETNDFKTGWDGSYKNKTQNDDVFLYKIEGIDFFDRPLKAEGYIHLMH